MRNKKSLLAILTLLAVNTLFAQDYAVQVAAYSDPVSMDRFKDLPGTYLQPDHNNIYRYYLGPYVTEDFAEKVRRKALAAGFEFARVVNLTEIRELCKRSCSSPGDATFAEETPTIENSRYIQHLFFDFDRSFLKPQSLAQLDGLKQILDENPSYRAELHGHTDAVGTEEYNVTLSRRRALKTKNYLVEKGISADRLDVQIYGKDRPIAKNFLKGRDSEEGRRLNRRVEIRIIAADGQIVGGLVEAISVPDYLKVE
jgi:outer membrane protein OmpA-like peptidoglycan-associated protein